MEFRNIRAITLGLILVLAPSCSSKSDPDADPSSRSDSGFPPPVNSKIAAREAVVEEGAVDALKEMSNFLMTATTMGIQSEGSLDAVTRDGQRIQLDGTTTYKVRRPGFVIDYQSDIKDRRFIYDGKTFTIYSPEQGFYATVPAPPTNREALDEIYEKFGITLPLEDLFRWSDGALEPRIKALQSAYEVGTATIDGVETDHYAFREEGIDWQLWIEQGDKPFPRKLVIVDRNDPARPTFVARLKWTMNPTFAASDFAFRPDADDKRIALAKYLGSGT
jgi:hypothetical protein